MHKHGIFLSKREHKNEKCLVLGLQHRRNYTLITIIQLLYYACARALHILCIFIIAICTTAKRNKTHANTLRCIPLCSVCLFAPIPFHFWVVAIVLNCSGKSTLCQRCKIVHSVVDLVARQSNQEQHIICLSLFYCYAIGMRVASRKNQETESYVCAFTFQLSQVTPCALFFIINLLLSCQFFLTKKHFHHGII